MPQSDRCLFRLVLASFVLLFSLSTAFSPLPTTPALSSTTNTAILNANPSRVSFDLNAAPSRRAFVVATAASISSSFLSTSVFAAEIDESAPSDSYEALLLLLRAQESTAQELNLLKTGKYKNFQRANVKLAVRYILRNYGLTTNFAKLSGTSSKLSTLSSSIVSNLNTILEYFDDRNTDSLKIAPPKLSSSPLSALKADEFPMPENPDLDNSKKKVVINGLSKTVELFDEYFGALEDQDMLAKAKQQVADENEKNKQEYAEFVKTDIINIVPSK
ncbi:hypothetical protein TrVE_jg12786 [Triparma verrucosa]|uniref:Uncharacterized protein n=1 Tax=Triparma verrucosa TaxID=1606542 RepID=A0A9W7F9C5_9STRA|nr:hypothetical protein TrVE_jg12786 [Triparma verrucosa]